MAEEGSGKNYVQELKLIERQGELDAHNTFLQKVLDGISKEQSDEARVQATQSQTQAQTINEVIKQLAPMLQQSMTPQQSPMRQPTMGIPAPTPNQLPTADQSGPITGVPSDFVAALRQKRGDLETIKKQLRGLRPGSAEFEASLYGKKSRNDLIRDALIKESGLTEKEIDSITKESGISQGEQRLKLSERQMNMLEQEYKRKAAREPMDDSVKFITEFSKGTENPAQVEQALVRKGIEFAAKNGRDPTRQEWMQIYAGLPEGILKNKVAADSYQNTGPYINEQGQYIGEGVFHRGSGSMMLRDRETGQVNPMPQGARPITEGNLDRNVMTGEQFSKLARTANEEEQSLRSLKRYWESVKDTSQGWRLLADQYIGQIKTIFGKDLNNQKQFDTLIQSGRLQGLLGRFRKDIVGGGVMTEQDAHRVIAALGGDVNALRNKDVVAQLLKDMMNDRAREYNSVTAPLFNAQITGSGRGGFNKKEPVDVSKLFIPAKSKVETISNDAEYDSLPSGAVFIGPDGKQRKKP